MKKYLLLFSLAALFSIVFIACEDDSTGPDPVGDVGTLIIQSNPTGATVFIDNVNKGTTNDTIPNVAVGTRTVRLELADYRDTTFTVTIAKDQSTLKVVELTSSVLPPNLTKYGPVKVWETTGTTVSEPSGLDLSEGIAVSSNDPDADLYYLTNASFTIHELKSLTSDFLVSSNSDLEDGEDSPLATNNWVDNVPDGTTNYFFIYDENGHYSKAKIVEISPSNEIPAWVRIEWYYNNVENDPRF
jgi:hypothetical protein